jgi:hypothetical protein
MENNIACTFLEREMLMDAERTACVVPWPFDLLKERKVVISRFSQRVQKDCIDNKTE